MVTFAETTTPANIKFAENRMLINKNGNINVFVKDGATFSPVQVIPSSSIASFDAQGSRIAFFVSNSEIHVYEWNGSEYVYFENIVNDEPDSVFDEHIAIENDRVAVTIKYNNSDVSKVVYYDVVQGSTTTDVISIQENQMLMAKNPSPHGYFGWDVSISDDNSFIAVGEPSGEGGYVSQEVVLRKTVNKGDRVAIHKNKLAVAYDHHVYVYELNGNDYVEIFYLATNPSISGHRSIEIDEDKLIIGYPFYDVPNGGIGKVEIYNFNNDTYTLSQTIISPLTTGRFGYDISLHGDILMVSRYHFLYPDLSSRNGSIHALQYIDGNFIALPNVLELGKSIYPTKISFDGNTLAVGGWYDVKLFEFNYSSGFQLIQTISRPPAVVGDGAYGVYMPAPAISGDTLLIGYGFADNDDNLAGVVAIYRRTPGGYEFANLIHNPESVNKDGDQFGHTVDISGTSVAIASIERDADGSVYVFDVFYESVESDYPGATPLPNNSGKTNIYQKTSLGYTSYGSIVSPFLQATDSFGGQISINKDGTQLVASEINLDELGAVHIYNRGPEKFRYDFTIYAPPGVGYFGWDVSLHDNVLAVSAAHNIFLYNIYQSSATLIQTISLPGTLSTVSIKQTKLFAMVATINNNLFTTKMYTWNGFNFQETQMSISGVPEKPGKISLSNNGEFIAIGNNYEDLNGEVHVFKNQGNFQYELLEDIDYPDEVYGVELSNDRLIIGRPFETFFIGDQGYGQAGRAYLYDITTSQKIDYFDTFERKGMINDVLYTTENKNLYLRNKNLFVNYLQNSSDQNANVNFYTWSNLSYNLTQTISKQNAVEFAYDYKMNNTGSSMFITFTNSSGQKQIDEYVFEEGVYVYKRSITNGGNTDFAIDGTRVITSTVENNQGKITAYKQKQEIIIDSTGSSDQTTVETYETEEGGEFKQIRIHLGAPYENFINVDKTLITERLPDITTENLINDGRTLTTDYQSVEEVRLSQTDLLYIYDVKLGQTVIGKYRVFLTSEPYIEVILYVIGLGYSQGLLEADLAKEGGIKIEVKYPSPNIRMARNTIPRLKSVNFQ